MKRKISAGLAVSAALFMSLFLSENGDARRKVISSTRDVVIDGRSFTVDDTPEDEISQVKRELVRRGVTLPHGFDGQERSPSSHPLFSGRLIERPGLPVTEMHRLPAGLTAEHTLRMKGNGKPVDLVFGNLDTPGPSIRSLMLSSGWKSHSAGPNTAGVHMLEITVGKETSIVFLDEADGTFLLLRESGK